MNHQQKMSLLETAKYTAEVCSVYELNDDASRVEKIKQTLDSIRSTCTQQQSELKAIIKEMTKRIHKAEQQATRSEPEIEHVKRLDMLQREKKSILNELSIMDQKCLELKENIMHVELSKLKIEQQNQLEQTQHDNEIIPTIENSLSLFSNISNIHWDTSQLDRVKGFIIRNSSDSKEVRAFDFQHAHPQPFAQGGHMVVDDEAAFMYETTDALWQLIEEFSA